MFFTLSRRWCSLLSVLSLILVNLLPVSAAPLTPHFSVGVNANCLSCSLEAQFPSLHSQLQGEMPWTATTRQIGKRSVAGLASIASSTVNTQVPTGLKPFEQQAWQAMAERGQMQLFSPQSYNGSTVVEQGTVRVEVQPLGAQSSRAQQQGKTLVYTNAYPGTDSLQVVKPGQSEEFLYLRNKTAPTVFDYQVKVSKGVQVRSVAGSIAFVDSQGQGVRIEKPWLVDSNGQRSESAVHWQMLEGGKHLRLVVEPQGLRYPLVVDPSWTTTGSMTTPRSAHTATLLANGEVLVAGGSVNSADLYNPTSGTWRNTGSTSISRRFHTATLLPNGTVLVTGGVNSNNNPLNSAEVYNPSTGTWSTTGPMNAGRFSHTATLLPNGKVLAVGGLNGNGFLSSTELYDPATGAWSPTASMSTSRVVHTATLLPAGTVLVAGGRDSLAPLSSVELYDPATGTWSTTGSMNTARFSHTATLLPNSKVLVIGGNSESGALSSAELYDPATGTWSTTGSVSAARYSHTATLLPNVGVLVVGGRNSTTRLGSAEIYDSATGTWSATSSLLAARTLHTATLLNNGKVLVAGGLGDMGDLSLSSAELYDPPTTGTWTLTGSMNTARTDHTATLLQNGKVLVAGGGDANGTSSSAELYDPQTGIWTVTGSLTTPRSLHTATLLLNGKVLVAGGLSNNAASTSAELYDPVTGSWSTVNSLSTPRGAHTAALLPNGKVLVAGGFGGASSSAEVYDPQTGTWSNTGSMVTARSRHTATLLPTGKVLVVGGQDSNFFNASSSVEVYDPQTGTWSNTGSMVTARSQHTATLLPTGKVLVVGGSVDSFSGLSSAEVYDPQTGTWSVIGSLSTGRYIHTATLLSGGLVLVTGGIDSNNNNLSSTEVYDPQTGTWSTAGSMSMDRFSHTATLLPNGAVLAVGGFGTSTAELYGLNAPVITSFTPTNAAVGSIVTLTGSGFTGVTSITLSSLFARPLACTASFGYVSDSQVNLQVAGCAIGTAGSITIKTPAGSATSATGLTVLKDPPTITSFSPTSGSIGTTVIINGANFTGATNVRFRTTSAVFAVLSDTQIQAVVPAGAKSGAIVVITPNGFNTSPTKFTVTP
jgi:N-acetylneuraminic acid mutarotase